MTVHASAAQGYKTVAETYVAGRPDYPGAARAWLRDTLALAPGKTVMDVGAGTGKFLPYLRETGAKVLALEPVDGMRARLTRDNPDVEAFAGTADRIPLPDASLDAIVCAQSFHWFATRETVAEFARVLKPGSMLGMIWNVRDENVDWVAAITAITDPYEAGTPRYKSFAWRKVFPADGFAELPAQSADNPHIGTADQTIIARTLSVSFVAALPEAEQRKIESRLRALIAATPALAGQATIAFPYITRMYSFRRV
ncbi:MAG: methyltransferase domain-containing protein [Alphaproteobacteria bacterium]|nr:methyltransferase domain-containing protein [Alphaproteobacteria bacterium]